MSILKTYWNFVDAKQDTSLKMFAKPTAIVDQRLVTCGCRGVFFRSVLTEDLDFSNVLYELKFEDVRKARGVPDSTLLFKPKCETEKSIGVLRVMKPRRFVGTSGINTNTSQVNLSSVTGRDFDVLLETTEFVLEDVQEQMAERFQLQETFGDFNVFFFGKRAEIFTYSGSLLNARGNLQWRNQFLDNYERFLRGTKCAELKARAYLLYDDVIREGFILSANINQNSMTEAVVKFSFTLLVTSKRIMGVVPPSRSGTLTLERKAQSQQGVTDFQFFRAVADDLPSVSSPTIPQGPSSLIAETEVDPSFNFIQSNSLPGDEPPADLKQMMMTRALSALQKVNSQQIDSGNDQSLDQDILLDFIPASSLGSNTKLIISGAKSLDVESFTGDQLIDLLLESPPKITVDDLKLKQARDVADSFSREGKNKDRIDPGTADTLEAMATYFATNSESRISKPVSAPEKGVITDANKYVLDASLDLASLNSILTTVAPLNNFDQKAANDLVIKNVKMSFIETALKTSQAGVEILAIEAYIAAFCLIKNPNTGNLFSEVTAQLPDAAGISGNSLDFVRDQQVSKIQSVIQNLPSSVKTLMSGAIAQLQSSTIMSLINSKLGTAKNEIFVNEAMIIAASPALPSASQIFLMALGIYISAIAAELSSDVPPACIDSIGGMMRPGASLGTMGSTYFTPSFLGITAPGQDTETSSVIIGPRTFAQNLHAIPSTTDWYLILPLVHVDGAVEIRGFGFNYKISQTDSLEQTLQQVGIIRVNDEVASKLIGSSTTRVVIPTTKRKTPVLFPECLSQTASGVVVEGGPPIPQNHLGTTPLNRYLLMTSSTFIATVGNIHQKLDGFKALVDKASQGLEDVLNDNSDPEFLDTIQKELSIDKFLSVPEIANVNNALIALGIKVSNVIDLVEYAKVESTMAANLATLKQRITDAIAQANNDPENQAAAVAKNNEAFTNSICG